MYKVFALLSTSVLFLTACSVSQDPRQGGFVGGLAGLGSGAYEARIQQRQDVLIRQQNANKTLLDQAQSLESDQNQRELEMSLEKQQLIQMEVDLFNLADDVNRLQVKSSTQEIELAELKSKIEKQRKKVKSQQNVLEESNRSNSDQNSYQGLKQERDRLAKEYEILFEYFETLSDAAY